MQRRENIFIRNIFGTQNYFAVVMEIFAYPLQSGPSEDHNTNNKYLVSLLRMPISTGRGFYIFDETCYDNISQWESVFMFEGIFHGGV